MEEKTLKQLSTLTDVYNLLVETERIRDRASKQIKRDFADPDGGWFCNPIDYTVSLEQIIEGARKSFTRFVVGQLDGDYKNLHIDNDAADKYTAEHGFDAETLIKTIREKYADEDSATLHQIRIELQDIIPWRSGKKIETPEGLERIRDNGFELRIYGYGHNQITKVAVCIQFVDIVLRGIAPSKVSTKSVKIGEVYRDDKIKSLRYFKNNALKVVFHTADDCERVKSALFAE